MKDVSFTDVNFLDVYGFLTEKYLKDESKAFLDAAKIPGLSIETIKGLENNSKYYLEMIDRYKAIIVKLWKEVE